MVNHSKDESQPRNFKKFTFLIRIINKFTKINFKFKYQTFENVLRNEDQHFVKMISFRKFSFFF